MSSFLELGFDDRFSLWCLRNLDLLRLFSRNDCARAQVDGDDLERLSLTLLGLFELDIDELADVIFAVVREGEVHEGDALGAVRECDFSVRCLCLLTLIVVDHDVVALLVTLEGECRADFTLALMDSDEVYISDLDLGEIPPSESLHEARALGVNSEDLYDLRSCLFHFVFPLS